MITLCWFWNQILNFLTSYFAVWFLCIFDKFMMMNPKVNLLSFLTCFSFLCGISFLIMISSLLWSDFLKVQLSCHIVLGKCRHDSHIYSISLLYSVIRICVLHVIWYFHNTLFFPFVHEFYYRFFMFASVLILRKMLDESTFRLRQCYAFLSFFHFLVWFYFRIFFDIFRIDIGW